MSEAVTVSLTRHPDAARAAARPQAIGRCDGMLTLGRVADRLSSGRPMER
jgi:hypothetical protein